MVGTTTIFQMMGIVLSVLGIVGVIAATAMDQWATEDLGNPATVVGLTAYSGLWKCCVRQSSGYKECRPYYTTHGLPTPLQTVRALMVVGIVLGVIGDLIAIFTLLLQCLKMGNMGNMENTIKATMSLTAGIMFILGGICGIAGASAFANMIVHKFSFITHADNVGIFEAGTLGMYEDHGQGKIGGLIKLTQTNTFGPALYVGWVFGAILFIAGIMMCVACCCMVKPEPQRYDGMAYKPATIYKPDSISSSAL